MRSIVYAGLAVSATAFLIPLEVALHANLLPAAAREPWTQTVTVDCPNCPVPMPNVKGLAPEKADSQLQFNFEVDLTTGKTLLLNGKPVFQVDAPASFYETEKTMPVVLIGDISGTIATGIEYELVQSDQVPVQVYVTPSRMVSASESKDKFEHLLFNLIVTRVAGEDVEIPTIQIDLLKDRTGLIAITDIAMAESPSNCDSWLCEWFPSLDSLFNDVVPSMDWDWLPSCDGLWNTDNSLDKVAEMEDMPYIIDSDDEIIADPLIEDNYESEWDEESDLDWDDLAMDLVTNVFLAFLVGVIGIFAGIASSVLGMLIGTSIVWAVRKVFGRSTAAAEPTVAETFVVGDEEQNEKSGLMIHQQPPPSYEDGQVDTACKV